MSSVSGSPFLTAGVGLFFAIAFSYAAGRVHQWTRQTMEREDAFRDGYNTATRALFSLATKTSKVVTFNRPSPVSIVRGSAKVGSLLDHDTPPLPLPITHVPRHRASEQTKIDLHPAPLLRKAGRRGNG